MGVRFQWKAVWARVCHFRVTVPNFSLVAASIYSTCYWAVRDTCSLWPANFLSQEQHYSASTAIPNSSTHHLPPAALSSSGRASIVCALEGCPAYSHTWGS